MAAGREIKETIGFTTTARAEALTCWPSLSLSLSLSLFLPLLAAFLLPLLRSSPLLAFAVDWSSSYEGATKATLHIFEAGNITSLPQGEMQREKYCSPREYAIRQTRPRVNFIPISVILSANSAKTSFPKKGCGMFSLSLSLSFSLSLFYYYALIVIWSGFVIPFFPARRFLFFPEKFWDDRSMQRVDRYALVEKRERSKKRIVY